MSIDERSRYAGVSPVASVSDPAGPVTLVEGQTFARSGASGDIASDQPHGLFVLDTRVLSHWCLRVNGHCLEPLGVELSESYAAILAGRGHAAPGHADATLTVFRHRAVGGGMRERIAMTNHGLEAASVVVELECDVDFADLFDVKERRERSPDQPAVQVRPNGLRYRAGTSRLHYEVDISVSDAETIQPGLLVWRTTLKAGEPWETCVQVTVRIADDEVEPRFRCGGDDAATVPARRMQHWRATVPTIHTDEPALSTALRRSGEDLGALRIFDPAHPELPVIAAGAPWFMTMFGRDSLLTAWMSLVADPSLAHGVLDTLARFQGRELVDATEEQPGKILHEIRNTSPIGGAGLGDGDIYYGSVDATPLFVMLLGELRRWHRRDELVDRLIPHADRALAWIEEFGDRDSDGYVEYGGSDPQRLVNQGWKDSWDAIRHSDGALAQSPIALCEVQGYTYAAYIARAHLARELGDAATHDRYARLARELRRRFNDEFWLEEEGTFALGLDADKRPISAIASNVGHCLWTGIVEPDKARSVADRLLADDLFTGWGIRTLASTMPAYNPVSYHNGSVWPHDNAIAAAGLARYGFHDHAYRIIRGQLDVAATHQGRLPELFAGFDREELDVPAAYPASCSPQAWAAASPLLWLRTILGLEPSVSTKRIWLAPRLPSYIRELRVDGITIAGQRIAIDVDESGVEVRGAHGYELVTTARSPLTREQPR